MEQPFFPVTRRGAERQGIPFSSDANKNAPFPSQLRELRKEKGISQEVLAKTLGVSKSTVGLWETGDTLPDAKALHDIAVYFKVTSDYLLGLSRSPKQESHKFADITHFIPPTIQKIMLYSRNGRDDKISKRDRISFECIICSQEFDEILDLLRDYLDLFAHIHDENRTSQEYLSMYVNLDSAVDKVSKGRLHVISSSLFAQTIITRAQDKIRAQFEHIKEEIDKCGGWKQYMP